MGKEVYSIMSSNSQASNREAMKRGLIMFLLAVFTWPAAAQEVQKEDTMDRIELCRKIDKIF